MKTIAAALLLFALTLPAAVASDANISFDNVAAAFRAAGYMVIGPMVLTMPSGQVSMISAGGSGDNGAEEFLLQLFDSEAAAIEGWYAVGNLIEIRRASGEAMAHQFSGTMMEDWFFPPQPKARGRMGRFVWSGTPGAMAVFDKTRN